ncbi:TIGR00296 family protein [Methanohalophilus mahii]|uniref:Protein Mmah_1651 n=1 Tax=Methanohalophilus mahii (strain ATCC 35705 / DSM 5219 / SLP) TaxID=547558 RepID=D5E7K9_METMS|nr:TIGR00296 family protein [Methanohalophilus mahii]ADE37147.1 AMMECR1 domain protein [Methanohalophilus mahii DSM 5219]
MLSLDEGKMAVSLARNTITEFLENGTKLDPDSVSLTTVFEEERGVFVTLSMKGDLRGCIGHPYPDSSLKDAIVDSAISASTRDPRFPPVKPEEMHLITVEVTVLTPPEKIDAAPAYLPDLIEIGRHGLIVKQGFYQGLLLPQVAPEQGFDAMEFLNHTCIKAGLAPDAWLTGAEVYWFEGQVFSEDSPEGQVVEKQF